MENGDSRKNDDTELRQRAEEILQKQESSQIKDLEHMSPGEIRQLLHELQVHQIELELQNEELRRAQSELEAARSRYYDLYDLAPVGYCTLSSGGLILKANLAAANMLKTNRNHLVRQPLSRYILPEDQDTYYFFRKQLQKTGQPRECELRMLGSDEHSFWTWLQATTARDEDGNTINRVVLININDRKQAEKALKQREQRQKLAVDIASDFLNEPLSQLDDMIEDTLAKVGKDMEADRCYIYEFSEEAEIITCVASWVAAGLKSQFECVQSKPFETPSWMCNQILFHHRPVVISETNQLPDQAIKDRKELKKHSIQSLIWVPMVVEDDVLGFIGVDCINSRKEWDDNDTLTLQLAANIVASAIKRDRIEKDLVHQTFHDQLTGLFNRSYFKEESSRLDVERQLPISLILADVNGLKQINDTYGHKTGDRLLKKVAKIFRQVCREEDIITRWGGDEFLILLPQTEAEEARTICDRIKEYSSENEELGIPISVALGYAVKEDPDEDLYTCIDKADDKMYKDKLRETRRER